MQQTLCSEKVNSRVIDTFSEKLKTMGIQHFYYYIIPDDGSYLKEGMGRSSKLYFGDVGSQKKMRFAVASGKNILQFRDEFLYLFSRSDCRFLYSQPSECKHSDPFYWPSNMPLKRRQNCLEHLLAKYDIDSGLTFYHLVNEKEKWLGVFHLFFNEERATLEQKILDRQSELISLLLEYSSVFNSQAHQEINPIANFGLLSPSCVKILAMVADGESSEDIGNKLFLTERGVNYHLDRARQILGAKNRTNLISKAYQKGLL